MDHTGLVFKVEIQQVWTDPSAVAPSRKLTTSGQIMYIAGETQDPSMGTLALIEDIIQKQVVQMVSSQLPSHCHV